MARGIEELIYNGVMEIVGDPVFAGALVLTLFIVFTLLQGIRTDGKIVILVPAFILSLAFIPILALPVVLVVSAVLYLGIMKVLKQ